MRFFLMQYSYCDAAKAATDIAPNNNDFLARKA